MVGHKLGEFAPTRKRFTFRWASDLELSLSVNLMRDVQANQEQVVHSSWMQCLIYGFPYHSFWEWFDTPYLRPSDQLEMFLSCSQFIRAYPLVLGDYCSQTRTKRIRRNLILYISPVLPFSIYANLTAWVPAIIKYYFLMFCVGNLTTELSSALVTSLTQVSPPPGFLEGLFVLEHITKLLGRVTI